MKTPVLVCLMCLLQVAPAVAQFTGIGTVSPTSRLHVNGGKIRVENSGAITLASFFAAGTPLGYIGAQGADIRLATWPVANPGGQMYLMTNGQTRLAIDSTGNTGIGTLFPQERLHVKGTLQVDAPNNTSDAAITLTGGQNQVAQLLFWNTGGPQVLGAFGAVPGRSFWSAGTSLHLTAAGLGIQNSNPLTRLHITGGQDAGLSTTANGYLMLGSESGNNLVIDNNEILARSGTGPARLYLQASGGDVEIGNGSTAFEFKSNGELNRTAQAGPANLLPLCYGTIRANGTIAGGTGNFSVTRTATGVYHITIDGETGMSNAPNNYIIIVQPVQYPGLAESSDAFAHSAISTSGNYIEVETSNFSATYFNHPVSKDCELDCDVTFASTIQWGPFSANHSFSILVFKQ